MSCSRKDKEAYRSKSGLCAVCRGPLPEGAGPNTRVCSKKCRDLATRYQLDLDVYVMPDEEYHELGLEPPVPGFRKCLGHGYPEHVFWSRDIINERICNACKHAAELGRAIHSPGSVGHLIENFWMYG